jgi:hypothetical protein
MPSGDFHGRAPSRFYHETFEFQIDAERHLVQVKFGERVTSEEIASYVKALRCHPAFKPTFAEIVDLREASELQLEAHDFLRLADQLDPFSREAKRAFVVRTSVQNHAARMHKILRAQRNISIFQTLEEAENWIELQ